MHPNPIYRTASDHKNLGLARETGFGVLSINGYDGPLLSHIPFLISTGGDFVDLHLVRSNPIARELAKGTAPAAIAVQGPHGYVSPDWYGVADQVPTWNYVAVHLRGMLELRPAEELRQVLDDLSAAFEARLAPKAPWKTGKMTPEVLDKMMRQIVPLRLWIKAINGTWKLNQNKAEAARLGAAAGISESGVGAELATLAQLMQNPDD